MGGTMMVRLLKVAKVVSGLLVTFYVGSYTYMRATGLPYFVRPRAYEDVLEHRLNSPVKDPALILATFPSGDPRGARGISFTKEGKVWLSKYSYSFATGGSGWGHVTAEELRAIEGLCEDPPPATSQYGQWSDQVVAWYGTPRGVQRRFYRWSTLPKQLRSLMERYAPKMIHRGP